MIQFAIMVEQRAKALLVQHPLRAYDAVQLASALVSNQQLATADLDPLVFVCGDSRLLEIARQAGLETIDPNQMV